MDGFLRRDRKEVLIIHAWDDEKVTLSMMIMSAVSADYGPGYQLGAATSFKFYERRL